MATALLSDFAIGSKGQVTLFQSADTDRLVTFDFQRDNDASLLTLVSCKVKMTAEAAALLTISGNNVSHDGSNIYTVPVDDMSVSFYIGGTGAAFQLTPTFSDGADPITVYVDPL